MSELLRRAIFVKQTEALRKSAIKGMVDVTKNNELLKPIKGDDRWASLSRSIDEFVAGAILTAG
jgi:hypothetical protein